MAQACLSHARENPGLGAIGKVQKGRAALDRAIMLDPDNLEARTTLMQFLLQAPSIVGGSKSKARGQAQEIARRNPLRGLLARLEIAAAVGKERELVQVYDEAAPVLGTPADSAGTVSRAFLSTASKVKDGELREMLTAKLRAARITSRG
ncbi:MAG: hypothetical protein H0W67_03440 [Gemmatimonadales bacterium]|nr:hypothetical protein [Gemmatimonadales bacterium]